MVGHTGEPLAPHDLWWAWQLDPVPLLVGASLAWAYVRGRRASPQRRPGDRRRDACLVAAGAALAVALASPLDALAGSLASAHMVQHLLLVLVVAPLLVLAAPTATVLRGVPAGARGALHRARRRLDLGPRRVRAWTPPVAVLLAQGGVLWFWHAAGPYDAAVRHDLVHQLEHVTYLVTAVLLWRVVVGSRAAGRVEGGAAVLVLFAASVQSAFLALLLTFARGPWYSAYAATTEAFGLGHLEDQRLAGVLMWVPAGAVYVVVALARLASWVDASGEPYPASQPAPLGAAQEPT